VRFEHDIFGNLSAAAYSDGTWDYKLPDEIGNLFKSKDKKDRQYGKAGQLLKDEKYTYTYDEVGNLIEKESVSEVWKYRWTQSGMLKTVVRPDRKKVEFTYDALGRRLTKTFQSQTTHFVWDGNVPLHEWTTATDESNFEIKGGTLGGAETTGELEHITPENLITWIFEDGTFIPMAKLQDEKSYSIITDHLGTPTEAYDEQGEKVWSRQLNIYGETRRESGEKNFIPFLYQGQYFDEETELAYNRYRYYSPETGLYVSQDPIGLDGNNPNIYAYTRDSNIWVDPKGLEFVSGQSLPGDTKLYRVGGGDVGNLGFNDREIKAINRGQLDPPGISLIRANSAEEAGNIMKAAFPKATGLHQSIDSGNIAETTAKKIREAGFDVIHDPTKRLGDAHARLIHPNGVDGFSDANKSNLSSKFNSGCG
ncbi:MAG: RHS domain-containing protein, partial [Flavobacteriales bacterium]|nr:RHS domain-containing protein [Flavobacteriales bacterium]